MPASSPHGAGLYDRAAQLARVGALLDDAQAGTGGALLLEGPPGIGKSRLVAAAEWAARARGFEVAATTGHPVAQSVPLAAARHLLLPLVEAAPATEGGRRAAQVLLDPSQLPAPDALSSLTGGAAAPYALDLAALVVDVAAGRPLLLAVDDAHWVDPATLAVLEYVVGLAARTRLAVLLAFRPAAQTQAAQELERLRSLGRARVVTLPALSKQATAHLLHEATGREPDDDLVRRCHAATGGVPLLVREVATALQPAPAADVDAAAVLDEAVRLRLAALAEHAQLLARAVAVLGHEVPVVPAAALAGLGTGAATEAADALIEARLLAPGVPLSFLHPLVQEAVLDAVPPAERGRLHGRAAALLHASGADSGQISAHLLRCDSVGEQWAVEVLSRAAERAAAAGSVEAELELLRRALREPLGDAARDLLQLRAGEALLRAGQPQEAARVLADLTGHELSAAARVRLERTRGGTLLLANNPEGAIQAFAAAAAAAAQVSVDAALLAEAELLQLGFMLPRLDPFVRARLDALPDDLPGSSPGERLLLVSRAAYQAYRGEPDDRVRSTLERAFGGGRLLHDHDGPAYYAWILLALDVDAQRLAERALELAAEDARLRGSRVHLEAILPTFGSDVARVRGDVAEAERLARAGLEVAEQGWRVGIPYAAGYLALALLDRGAVEDADAVLTATDADPRLKRSAGYAFVLAARVRVRLAQGVPGATEADLERLRRASADGIRLRRPTVRALSAAAALARGDRPSGLSLLRAEIDWARRVGNAPALGAALRELGVAVGGDEGLALLFEAVEVLEPPPPRLEHTAALVALGSALRRANRRAESRAPLRAALTAATSGGATALAERARTELAATGERVAPRATAGAAALTASERRVAALAASGLTNPQIAARLHVSRKTVEMHLGRAYAKLGVRSRADLPRAL